MEVLEYKIKDYFNSIDMRMFRMIRWCLSCVWWFLNWEHVLVDNLRSPSIGETLLKFQYDLMGPQTDTCIFCGGWLALDVDFFRKLLWNCLPIKHPSQLIWCIINGRLFNISFCTIFKLSKFTCLSLIYQSQVSSFTHAFRHIRLHI